MTDTYLYGHDERLIAWAQSRLQCEFRSDAKAIGLERNGDIAGAVVFDTFSPGDCLVHLVSDGSRRWLTREFITRSMAYPFLQIGQPRISCIISSGNTDSLRFTRHFGWTQEGVLREAGAEGEDLILFGMLRRECRFLSPGLLPTGFPAAGAL